MVLRPGDTLRGGQYEIKSVLGQGGFGITYKAWDQNLKRYVVLKAQLEHLRYKPGYENYVERFMKEGQIMAKLPSHPNLVRVFDLFSEPDNHPYLVMEFIKGQTLYKVVKEEGKRTEAEVISIAKQIGSALELMHDHQLVHRDVHPSNIMICSKGEAVLIDLGGAKEFIASPYTSEGTYHPIFSPLEQRLNPKGTRHPSADIFSLAGSLYFAVTGKDPDIRRTEQSTDEGLTPPCKLVKISEGLNAMLMAGLELEADNRPQSIQELLLYLENNQESLETEDENSEESLDQNNLLYLLILLCCFSFVFLGIGSSVPSSMVDEAGHVFGIVTGEKTRDVISGINFAGPSSDLAEALHQTITEGDSWKLINGLLVITPLVSLVEASWIAAVGSCIVMIIGAYLVAGITAGMIAAIASIFLCILEFNQTVSENNKVVPFAIFLGICFVFGTILVLSNGFWGFGDKANLFDAIISGLWWGSSYFSNQILRGSLDLIRKKFSNRSKISLIFKMSAATSLMLMSFYVGHWLYSFKFPDN
jgi:serine/threonine protein kinase